MAMDQSKYRIRVNAKQRSPEFLEAEQKAEEQLFYFKHILAANIQSEVKMMGMTQNELAEKLQLSQSDVSRILSANPADGILSAEEIADRKNRGLQTPSHNLDKRSMKMLLTILSVLGVETKIQLEFVKPD